METYIAIPESVCDTYWTRPFSELVRLAAAGTDGICDAIKHDRSIWEQQLGAGETVAPKYEGVTSWAARKRMAGFAIMREGRGDVARLHIQNFER